MTAFAHPEVTHLDSWGDYSQSLTGWCSWLKYERWPTFSCAVCRSWCRRRWASTPAVWRTWGLRGHCPATAPPPPPSPSCRPSSRSSRRAAGTPVCCRPSCQGRSVSSGMTLLSSVHTCMHAHTHTCTHMHACTHTCTHVRTSCECLGLLMRWGMQWVFIITVIFDPSVQTFFLTCLIRSDDVVRQYPYKNPPTTVVSYRGLWKCCPEL